MYSVRIASVAVAWCWMAGLTGCREQTAAPELPAGSTLEQLWSATAGAYLADPLWTDDEAYDAGHYLMVPLHAAFALGNSDWQRAFAEHFERAAGEWVAEPSTPQTQLARLQYLYLAAEFLALAAPTDPSQVPALLPPLLQTEIRRVWEQEPAWQWGRDPFPGGMRERLLWKLSTPSTEPSFHRAVVGEELFVMAIAADLRRYAQASGWAALDTSLVNDILRTAMPVFQQRVVWRGPGWLFQPGVWADHPDFAHAGLSTVGAGERAAPLTDVAEDVSHSHRFPLWLQSLAAAFPSGTPEHSYFQELTIGLAAQFFGAVLRWPVPDSIPISTSNYMDGRDGLYRWEYVTQGPGQGYGPSELSGTLTLGWWAFLPGAEPPAVYRDLAGRFPLDSATVALYVGPNTLRPRNPLVALPAAYSNGFAELLVKLAAELATAREPAAPYP
jgi:hypothetical protein